MVLIFQNSLIVSVCNCSLIFWLIDFASLVLTVSLLLKHSVFLCTNRFAGFDARAITIPPFSKNNVLWTLALVYHHSLLRPWLVRRSHFICSTYWCFFIFWSLPDLLWLLFAAFTDSQIFLPIFVSAPSYRQRLIDTLLGQCLHTDFSLKVPISNDGHFDLCKVFWFI